jgi:hypothetical protein
VASALLAVSLERSPQWDVLKLATQDVVFSDIVQVAGEPEDAEHAYEQCEADAEISPLQSTKGATVYICSRSDVRLRHVAS